MDKDNQLIENLKSIFEGIRDERRTSANTATRIGNAFLSLLSVFKGGMYLSKVQDDKTEFNLEAKGLKARAVLVEDETEGEDIVEDVGGQALARAYTENTAEHGGDSGGSGGLSPSDVTWGQLQNIDPSVDGIGRGLYALEKLRSGRFSVSALAPVIQQMLGEQMPIRVTTLDDYDKLTDKGRTLYFIMYGSELHYIYFGSTLVARKGKSEGGESNGFPYTFPFSF